MLQVFGQVHLRPDQILDLSPHTVHTNFTATAKNANVLHLLCRPEGGLSLLVHLPDVVVLYGENDKPTGVVLQQRLHLLFATVAAAFLRLKNK